MISYQLLQMLPQFKANPIQFLLQRRYNVPADLANNPNEIMNHLLQTGQINQQQIDMAYQRMGMFRR